jgi:hypothetical protein
MTTTDEKSRPVSDLFEQAMKNYEQALKTGMKFQEESSRVWSGLLGQATSPQDWGKKVKAMADEVIPQTQKSLEDGLKLIEQSNRSGIDLLKKAVAVAQAASAQEAQSRCLGFWEASLNVMRDTAVAATQAHNKAMESWVTTVRRTTEGAAATVGSKP